MTAHNRPKAFADAQPMIDLAQVLDTASPMQGRIDSELAMIESLLVAGPECPDDDATRLDGMRALLAAWTSRRTGARRVRRTTETLH